MKKELAELQKMLGLINQDKKRSHTSNPTINFRNKKESNDTSRAQDMPLEFKNKPFLSNLKYKEIYSLIYLNSQPEENQRSNKHHSQYNPITSSKPIKQTKAQKKCSRVINEMFPESQPKANYKSTIKAQCQLKLQIEKIPSFQTKSNNNNLSTNNMKTNYQDQRLQTKSSIASKYTSYFTSNDYYNDRKNLTEYPEQRSPQSNWLIKQQEKYKYSFYQEKSDNIRNLVSITDNKEHRLTNAYYGNRNNIYNNITKTILNSKFLNKNKEIPSKEMPNPYDELLDNFTNRLFKQKPLLTRSNEPRKYASNSEHVFTANAPSFKRDSLITNYNK